MNGPRQVCIINVNCTLAQLIKKQILYVAGSSFLKKLLPWETSQFFLKEPNPQALWCQRKACSSTGGSANPGRDCRETPHERIPSSPRPAQPHREPQVTGAKHKIIPSGTRRRAEAEAVGSQRGELWANPTRAKASAAAAMPVPALGGAASSSPPRPAPPPACRRLPAGPGPAAGRGSHGRACCSLPGGSEEPSEHGRRSGSYSTVEDKMEG